MRGCEQIFAGILEEEEEEKEKEIKLLLRFCFMFVSYHNQLFYHGDIVCFYNIVISRCNYTGRDLLNFGPPSGKEEV